MRKRSKQEIIIEEIEMYGQKLYEYMVEENQHPLDDEIPPIYEKEWAGTTVGYKHKDKRYEITTWNENSKVYDEGNKTLVEF